MEHTEIYKGYKIEIGYDEYSDGPTEWGNFELSIFNSGFRGELNRGKSREEFYTDNDKLNPGILSKIRAGSAVPVGVRHYSSTDGGYYSVVDAADADGFIEFDADYIKGISKADRLEYAAGDLKTYQAWANGDVYSVYIYDDSGELIDGNGGIYADTLDELLNDARATIDRFTPDRASAKAPRAAALHA